MESGRTEPDLPAFDGRTVVYCHICQGQWYADERLPGGAERDLFCTRCQSADASEKVENPEDDPRHINEVHEGQHGAPPDFNFDSDPDEADIGDLDDDDHMHNGPGFFTRRNISRSPQIPFDTRPRDPRARPDDGGDIIRRFAEMLGEMGGPVGRSGPAQLFPGRDRSPFGQGTSRVTYTTFSTGPSGGMSSVTIMRSNDSTVRTIGGGPGHGDDQFQTVFGDIFGRVGPPLHQRDLNEPQNPAPGAPPGGPRGPVDLATALNELFASVLNPQAIHGDAVYSQEALDRIISNLMENNPQSNAPAPATAESIARLPKKKLDEQMLGPELKGECTICIDDMHVGDEVTVLPCRHWFHEECVVLWLKQHNTCPICRAPIDGDRAGQPGAAAPEEQAGPSSAAPPAAMGAGDRRRSNLRAQRTARLDSIRDLGAPYERRQTPRRDSNSPPAESPHPPRFRSTSPDRQRSSHDGNSGSGGSNPLSWLRDQFSGGSRRRS